MPESILQVEHLTKHYGALTAVDDLSLDVYEGEIFGLLGPNGAGKTTSISMICGLARPDSGRVLIKGAPLNGSGARHNIGVCPQNIVLWGQLTCLEQLIFIGEMYGLNGKTAAQRGLHLLEELELSEKANQLARTLSGGMQRRLNLAMALVHEPEIVVLDEPEAGLDPQSRVKVREYIRSLRRSKTVILTTHDMDEADRLSDRIAIIDHGRLLVTGTPQDLKKQVGEGDVLELVMNGETDLACRVLEGLFASRPGSLRLERQNDVLVARALDVVSLLPAILETLSAADLHPAEIHLRQNTLEDVFIQLTGRRLRE